MRPSGLPARPVPRRLARSTRERGLRRLRPRPRGPISEHRALARHVRIPKDSRVFRGRIDSTRAGAVPGPGGVRTSGGAAVGTRAGPAAGRIPRPAGRRPPARCTPARRPGGGGTATADARRGPATPRPLRGFGFSSDEHFLASRSDGQVVHLSALLYHVLAELAPGRTADDVGARGERPGRQGAAARRGPVPAREEAGARWSGGQPARRARIRRRDGGRTGRAVRGRSEKPESRTGGGRTASEPAKANPLLALRLHKVLLSARATNVAARGLNSCSPRWPSR